MFPPEFIKTKRQGSALLITMGLMAMIFFVAISAAGFLRSQIKLSSRQAFSAPAYYAAESGIECMLYEILNQGNNRNTAETNCEAPSRSQLGNASYFIDQSQQGQIITIIVIGNSGLASRAIQAQLNKE